MPKISSAISAKNANRRITDRSRRVVYPIAPNTAMNSAVAPPDCHRICGSVDPYQNSVGAAATPSRIPNTTSSPVASPADFLAAKFITISTTNAPIQATIAAPSDRCRPAYAPSANTAAVSATSPIVWPNSVAVWSRVV